MTITFEYCPGAVFSSCWNICINGEYAGFVYKARGSSHWFVFSEELEISPINNNDTFNSFEEAKQFILEMGEIK